MKKLLLLSLCAAGVMSAQAQVVINEVMQSNIDCIMDDIHEFPDSWVELYNTSSEPINLKDYKIGLTDNAAEAFSLTTYTLGAKSYKIIYCDKYDGNKAWHAPFRLESGKGGSIYLFKGSEVVDKIVEMKKQPAPNIAYGRETDGAEKQGYQAVPTPGKTNCGTLIAAKNILGNPVFSVPGRVYESAQSFDLTLSLPEGSPKGAKIVYTTDGKEPTENSTVYSAPLKISSSQVIRAKVVCEGYMSPRSFAQSYLFLDRKMTLPVVSLVTDRDYFYGSQNGIYNSNNNSKNKLDWRRPLNIEYFAAPNEDSKINQLGETRVAGGGSRDAQYKTLVLYANKRFDADQKRFSYEFFPEDRPGKTEFKSLMLRNSGNDFDYLYLRDAVMQRSFAWNVDLDYQAYSPAIVFINGKYLGMLNIRERSNEDNIYTNYDKLEDIDMFENWGELKTGTWDNLNKFKDFYTEQGHTMAEFEKWMDCKEFANLMIMNLFYVNLDFPGNNIVMWRPTAENGRWRWIAKDTDFGLGLYGRSSSYKTLDWIYNNNFDHDNAWANQPDHTRLFRRLMADKDFSNMFFDLCCVYMGDFLNYDYIWPEIWSPMYERIKFEYPYHRKMINEWWPNYNDEMNNAKNWLKKRVDFFYDHLATYYKLGKAIKLEVNTTLSPTNLEEIEVTMNDVKLTRNTFKGKFHKGRTVRLSGKNVDSWTVVVDYGGEATGYLFDGSELSYEIPECSSVSIRATVGESSGIEQVRTEKEEQILDIYDLSGIRHSTLQKGQNIIRMKDGSTKKVIW